MNKKKELKYLYHKDKGNAMSWCLKNNIKIGCMAVETGKNPPVRIVITNGNTNNISPETYPQNEELYDKISGLYFYYWEKYRES